MVNTNLTNVATKRELAGRIINNKHHKRQTSIDHHLMASSSGSNNKKASDMVMLEEMQIHDSNFQTVPLEEVIIQEREKAAKDVHKQMVGINQVFNDMALLVREQGETVDNIESSIENAKVTTRRGVDELQQAEQKKDWSRTVTATVATVGTTAAAVALIILL